MSTAGNGGRPPFDPSDRFNAFANGFSNTAQGMMLLSFSRGSPTALRRS